MDRDRGQKTSLTKLVLKRSVLKQFLPNSQCKFLGRSQYESYIEAAQNFIQGRTIIDRDRGQKTSLTKLVLKRSVLKQSLPNSQCKFLWRSQYESYIEAAQNFIQGRTIFDRDRGQKTSLTKLVLKRSVLKQFFPKFQCKVL